MVRAKKSLERLKKIEEEYNSVNELAKISKYLLVVKRHFSGLKTELNNLGYDCEIVPEFIDFPRVDRDYKTHLWLNAKRKNTKDKPIIFITKNYSDFKTFTPRNYTIFEVLGNYFTDKLVNKVIDLLRNKSLEPDKVFPLNSQY